MVREARFVWDSHEPAPAELTRRPWDTDDPDLPPPPKRAVKRRGERSAKKPADNRDPQWAITFSTPDSPS